MVITKDITWVIRQYNLGVEYYNRHTSERAADLEQALIAFEDEEG